MQVSDRHAVVGHRDVLGAGLGDAAQYVAPVEHTGAAVDYQVVGREVGGKVRAGNHIDPQCGSDPFAEHRRNFDPADVFAHRSVRAGLGDQHAGVFAELPDGCRALHEVVDVALVTGEEHRERS